MTHALSVQGMRVLLMLFAGLLDNILLIKLVPPTHSVGWDEMGEGDENPPATT